LLIVDDDSQNLALVHWLPAEDRRPSFAPGGADALAPEVDLTGQGVGGLMSARASKTIGPSCGNGPIEFLPHRVIEIIRPYRAGMLDRPAGF
jgi:hypothetical protein